jgi:hypothetical protein
MAVMKGQCCVDAKHQSAIEMPIDNDPSRSENTHPMKCHPRIIQDSSIESVEFHRICFERERKNFHFQISIWPKQELPIQWQN